MTNCYVYLWFRPSGVPLYVGWGKWRKRRKQRWEDHTTNSCNRHLAAAFRKYGIDLPIIIVRDQLNAEEAKALEILLISAIGRSDLGNGPLANQTDGGDGSSNLSPEARKRLGDARRGKKLGPCPPERRIKISNATKGRVKSEAECEAISLANRGRIRSPEFKDKVSAGMKRHCEEHGGQTLGKKLSPEFGIRVGNFHRGRKRKPETKQKLKAAAEIRMEREGERDKIGERTKAAWADPVIRERQIAAMRAAAARRKALKEDKK